MSDCNLYNRNILEVKTDNCTHHIFGRVSDKARVFRALFRVLMCTIRGRSKDVFILISTFSFSCFLLYQ